jgi:hypothetical protein
MDLAERARILRERARIQLEPFRALALRLWRDQRPLVIGSAAAVAVVLALTGLFWGRCGLAGCPNVDRLRAYQPGKASRLLDRHGRVFADLRPVEGATVPLGLIPKHVRDAFLAVEDQRFYAHGGVDWRRGIGAALANVRSGGIEQGFSTVTMQLARNVFPEDLPGQERTLGRKVLEVRPPVELNKGRGVEHLLEGTDITAALYAGDDNTDLDAFAALRRLAADGRLQAAVCVGVASDETPPELEAQADVLVDGPVGVRALLSALVD